MSSDTSTIAGGVAMKVVIKPILGFMDASDPQLSKLAIDKTITLNPRTLVKDLCKSVMEGCNLGHVGDNFEVFVRYPNLEYYPFRTFFRDMNASIGSVAVLFEGMLTIKILIPKNLFYDYNRNTIKPDVVYEKFIKYMISELSDNRNQLSNPIIQYVKNEMEDRSFEQLPSETLSIMDRELTNLLQWRDGSNSPDSAESDVFNDCVEALNSIIGNISTTTSPQENNAEVQIGGGRPKKGVKLNKEIESPVLELLYSRSDTHDFERYACGLNVLSGRTGSKKITPGDIFTWFNRRRAQDRVNQRPSME